MTDCKHCGKPIKFVHLDGRWKPMSPETGEPHRCELPQKCQGCGVTFQGPPWMKECSQCYRGGLDKDRVFRGRQTEAEPAREPERLKEGGDEDDTPF